MTTSQFKSILVTGATGFIGSALIPVLLHHNYIVRILTRKSSPPVHLKCKNFIFNDLSNIKNLKTSLQGVDVIIHLAGRAHIIEKEIDPLFEYRKNNVHLTLNLARHAAILGVKRFIFISSIKVNGESTEKTSQFFANDKPNPTDFYAISKLEAELALLELAKETSMEVVIIRPPLIYGPGVKANFLSMINWLHSGLPLPFGNVNNKRSLIFIDNLVDFIMKVIDHPKAAGEIFLVSDGRDISTTSLLESISFVLGKKARLIPMPTFLLRLFFYVLGKNSLSLKLLASLRVNILKNKRLLNWNPPVSFEEGILLTVKDYLQKTNNI